MRNAIFVQSSASPQIAANPNLIKEIFTLRTPQEIELVLEQLSINIDTPLSAPIKAYIVEYGGEYAVTPQSTTATGSLLDGLPLTYFSPSIRATAKGLIPDSNQYVLYLKQQEE